MPVRTRFAPSPTGALHIGSARVALYAWLYARKMGGTFVLRIEDTDRERSTQAFTDAIIEGMRWLGLDWDEGPIHQMDRLDRYRTLAQQLIDEGHAYRCYCSKERLDTIRADQLAKKLKPRYDGHCRHLKDAKDPKDPDAGQPYVVRFKNPQEGYVEFHDAVHGTVRVQNAEMDDLVMIRSDGIPTYNFSVVVDDADMQITHVIRGDDHLTNTPRQINILKALRKPIPQYAHLPLILGRDGQKLSKRHGATSVSQYADEGYLPQAMLNYLVRLGWSHGDQEIFSVEQMLAFFSLDHLSKSPATFDPDKLIWLNQYYLKTLPPMALVPAFKAQLKNLGITDAELSVCPLEAVIQAHCERAKTLKELADMSCYVFKTPTYNESAAAKQLTPAALPIFTALATAFENIPASDWKPENLHAAVQSVVTQLGVGLGKVAQPLRVALTGDTASPSIDQTLCLVGKNAVLQRIETAQQWVNRA